MKYTRFEELPVWQAAVDFALLVFKFTNLADLCGLGDTKIQLERSSLSISNNVAKGFERGNAGELVTFLYAARAACGEARSMLSVCERVPRFANFRSEISNLRSRGENISKQLHGWIGSIKDSDIGAQRQLSQEVQQRIAKDLEFAELDIQMKEFRRRHLDMLERRREDAELLDADEEFASRRRLSEHRGNGR